MVVLKDPIKNEKGIIKYIGELENRQGTYYGLQLDVCFQNKQKRINLVIIMVQLLGKNILYVQKVMDCLLLAII